MQPNVGVRAWELCTDMSVLNLRVHARGKYVYM